MAERQDENPRNLEIEKTRRDEELRSNRMRDEQVSVPVVEEELAVGKRSVETGGVRVHKNVTEVPVEESVNLHEERVTVDRRPVDREIAPGELRAFQNETIEMREMGEEAVVEKRARVVEEVVVGKEARDRTEHITDTVRRSDVQIEPIVANGTRRNVDGVDADFRNHYDQNFKGSGWDYDSGYSHAYRYGHDLAGSGREWNALEPDVRSNWETRNKGTWERFKDAIRYGYDKGRN